MRTLVSLGALLLLFWILLSFHFAPLLLGLGLASCGLTLWLSKRLGVVDRESHPIHIGLKLARFWGKLLWAIVKANVDVVVRILGLKPIEPGIITIEMPFQSNLAKVVYANAVTLTPGTASIDMDDKHLMVHGLYKPDLAELEAFAQLVPDEEKAKQ